MLWYKGWLETRYRLLFVIAYAGLMLTFLHPHRNSPQGVNGIIRFSMPALVMGICTLLAGAGVATQPTLTVSKGIHGSTLFTLSLPVTRFRLLAVRAGIGWLEGIGLIGAFCCELWLMSPALRVMVTGAEMFRYAGALIACASAIYCLSVLLGTFLDDQWRVWCTFMGSGTLWWLSTHARFPAFVDIFRGMSEGSPLISHTMPWGPMSFSVGLAAVLFFAALKVVQSREY
jgi:hypothetical protein